MSWELIREVLDHAPEMTPAEGLVLVAIAEETRAPGQSCAISSADMMRRTRGMSASGVRKALARLAERGIEVRVPIGSGTDGRPVYTVPGQVPVYRLPPLPAPAGCTCDRCDTRRSQEAGPQSRLGEDAQVTGGGTTVPPWRQGGTTGTPGGTTVPPRRDHRDARRDHSPPLPSISIRPSSPHARAASILREAGASEDETRRVIEEITTRHSPRSVSGYVRALAESGDLPALIDEVRAARAAADRDSRRAELRAAIERAEREGPHCGHGTPGGAYVRPDTGKPHCPICRTATSRTEIVR